MLRITNRRKWKRRTQLIIKYTICVGKMKTLQGECIQPMIQRERRKNTTLLNLIIFDEATSVLHPFHIFNTSMDSFQYCLLVVLYTECFFLPSILISSLFSLNVFFCRFVHITRERKRKKAEKVKRSAALTIRT